MAGHLPNWLAGLPPRSEGTAGEEPVRSVWAARTQCDRCQITTSASQHGNEAGAAPQTRAEKARSSLDLRLSETGYCTHVNTYSMGFAWDA